MNADVVDDVVSCTEDECINDNLMRTSITGIGQYQYTSVYCAVIEQRICSSTISDLPSSVVKVVRTCQSWVPGPRLSRIKALRTLGHRSTRPKFLGGPNPSLHLLSLYLSFLSPSLPLVVGLLNAWGVCKPRACWHLSFLQGNFLLMLSLSDVLISATSSLDVILYLGLC